MIRGGGIGGVGLGCCEMAARGPTRESICGGSSGRGSKGKVITPEGVGVACGPAGAEGRGKAR